MARAPADRSFTTRSFFYNARAPADRSFTTRELLPTDRLQRESSCRPIVYNAQSYINSSTLIVYSCATSYHRPLYFPQIAYTRETWEKMEGILKEIERRSLRRMCGRLRRTE